MRMLTVQISCAEWGTRLVCDPAYIVGRITIARVRIGKIVLGCVSSDEVGLYF